MDACAASDIGGAVTVGGSALLRAGSIASTGKSHATSIAQARPRIATKLSRPVVSRSSSGRTSQDRATSSRSANR